MRTPPDDKRRKGGPPQSDGGRALERLKQQFDARGLEVPDVENPTESDALPLADEEPAKTTESTPDDKG